MVVSTRRAGHWTYNSSYCTSGTRRLSRKTLDVQRSVRPSVGWYPVIVHDALQVWRRQVGFIGLFVEKMTFITSSHG